MISQSLKGIFQSFKTQFSLAITWLSSAFKNIFPLVGFLIDVSLCLFIRPSPDYSSTFHFLHPLFICWQTQKFLPVFSLLISLSPFVNCLSFLPFVPHIVPWRCVRAFIQRSSFQDLEKDQTRTRFILVILDVNGGLKQGLDLPTRGKKIIGINKW